VNSHDGSDRGQLGRSKMGWADDVVAPRQEIDTLSLLLEEAAIQKALDEASKDEITEESFLELYRAARDRHRTHGSVGFGEKKAEDLTQALALFGAQASIRARRQTQERTILICNCPDKPGILAALSEAIADEGGNIMGAFMSVVGEHLVTAFLLSGLGASGIKPDAAKRRLIEIAKRHRGQPPEPEEIRIVSTPMKLDDGEYWARPGASWRHASARYRGEASLLRELTEAIAKRDLPLIALSSWRETDVESGGESIQVVDLNLAVSSAHREGESKIVRGLEAELKKSFPEIQLDIVPVRWPTRYRSHGSDETHRAREAAVTIVGQARPGFVHYSVRALEDIPSVVKIRGSSMAILEGISVLTVVFTYGDRFSFDEIQQQVKGRLSAELTNQKHVRPIAVQVGETDASRIKQWRPEWPRRRGDDGPRIADAFAVGGMHWPTHELSIQAIEQPRVVAKVARLLATFNVNITWFMSAVLDPVVGEHWPICAIRMHLHVSREHAVEIDRRLRSLADAEGWREAYLRDWSIDA
jgi:predicted amino acid-binding ACT domain protein